MAAASCTLRGVVEAVEAEFGDSILARDDAVAALSAGLASLGPPDLAWLQKSSRGGGLLFGRGQAEGEAQGYYHHVLGRDVSNSAAVAAYFALLTSRVEVHSGLSLWGSSECVIQRGFYCCWDAISGRDVRVELCIPGGVAAGCVDAAGQLSEATPLAFQNAQVSAFVRAMLVDADMRLNAGPLLAYDPCPSAAAEAGLLSTIMTLYSSGRLPGGLQGIAEQQGYGVAAEHTDLVCAAVWQHFRRRQRWEAAAEFFRKLAVVCPSAVVLLAAAERAQRVGQGAGGVLLSDKLAEVMARSGGGGSTPPPRPARLLVPATLVGLGHEQLAQGDSAAAAGLARRALAAAPHCRPAWLLLARAFIAARQFAAALVALNVMPNPPLPVSDVELLHVVAPPAPKHVTRPQVCAYDGEVAAARRKMAEAASLDGSRLLAYLPGSILVAAEPLGTAAAPDVCPDRITRSVLTACYDLLQDIVTQTGWDGFLQVRSRVFLMQHEVASSPREASSSSEITPQAGGHDSELQAAQHQQLLRKLQELGLHEQETDEQLPSQQQQQQQQEAPSSTSNGAGGQPATAAAEPSAAHGAQQAAAASGTASSPLPTPPASAGRQSSSRGSVGGVTPQAYYASRLDQVAKHRHVQEQPTTPSSQPAQQQQQQLLAPAAEPAAAPQQQEQQQQQPWAGRLLLLGRKTRAHTVPKEPHRPAAGAVGVGMGPGQGLAAHDLAYATASRVAPLRSSGSVTPALWSAVYGASRASSASPRPPATTTPTTADDSDDESLSTAAAGLPPIRTRPLGEAVEQQARGSGYTRSAHSFLVLQQPQQRQQQPLGEGLDRQGSLLRRATSIASSVGGSGIRSPQVSASSARLAAALAGAAGSGATSARRQSLLGDTSRLQADRDGLVAGSIHSDATCGGGSGGGAGPTSSSSDIPSTPRRRLCVRWLDELIVALWHDLQAHMEWRVVDETLRATRGGSAAELVLAPSKGPGGADAQSFEPALSSADWLRRGLLAERLGQQNDARMAYRAAVKLQFNLTALLALMRLEASRGSIEHTLSCVSQVVAWQQQDASSAGGTAVAPMAACAWVVGELADATSAEDVRRGIARLPAASQPPLSQLLDDWVSWQRHNRYSSTV